MRTYFAALALAVGVLPAQAGPGDTDEARKVAARIDEFVAAGYARNKVTPAAPVDDAGFIRRASLDVIGRTPGVMEVRQFLADGSPEKRARLVERLLDSPAYSAYMTQTWLDLLLPEAKTDFQRRALLVTMERWLKGHFANNTPYDRMTRELVAMPFTGRSASDLYQAAFNGGGAEATPASFYQAKGNKADDIAASVTRIFLGVRLECAQCHDHPFGKWKREEFWSQAAFFAGIRGPREVFGGPVSEAADRREVAIPNTDRVAQARFLDGANPRWKYKTSARATLADWMTAKDNPFFAKAFVNRTWAGLFGVGIVDPVDDLVDDNPASHPELLDYLAVTFAGRGYDVKFLIKAIVLSRTYQLSSAEDETRPTDPRLFARMAVKGLTGEQLYASLGVATGVRDQTPLRDRLFSLGTPRQAFLELFDDQERKAEYQTAIPQALAMMNSELIATATNPDRSRVLGAVADAPFLSDADKIEALFLTALSRKPTDREAAKFLSFVKKGGTKAKERKALGDV
ncbi:MAG: DUF1549 and DUF1553 domain-containing protein, partial [Gemmataceae bacterium]